MNKLTRKILLGLLALILLSPIGLILPEMFNGGDAWGEWSVETVAKDKGYVPKGMAKDASLWKAPVADYNMGKEDDPVWKQSGSYIISGLIGVGVIALACFVWLKLASGK
jgi:cobalt/nickel transport protein